MKIEKAINEATKMLISSNIRSSKLDSELLMSKVLDKSREFIILNSNYEISKKSLDIFRKLVTQRSIGRPIAYILGKKEFWNLEFLINENVLVPRPDTEIIIEQVLKLSKNKKGFKILDIGVGSGCILLTVLNEKKDFKGVGVDISKKCIDLSVINAKKIGILNRLKFFKSDIDNFNYGKYDLIISNPPYISKTDINLLDKGIQNYEPKIALYGGLDGLSEIRKVISKASELIKNKGYLILEIGFNQKDKVKKLLKKKGFFINKVLKDYAKNDRCIISTKL